MAEKQGEKLEALLKEKLALSEKLWKDYLTQLNIDFYISFAFQMFNFFVDNISIFVVILIEVYKYKYSIRQQCHNTTRVKDFVFFLWTMTSWKPNFHYSF